MPDQAPITPSILCVNVMPSSEIFRNPGVARFIAAIPDRYWAHAALLAASQNCVIPLIWLQISPCAYAPRTRVRSLFPIAIPADDNRLWQRRQGNTFLE